MDAVQQNVSRFNDLSHEWEADSGRVQMAQAVARAMLAALDLAGTERTLEFGAGTGLITEILAPAVASVTALDASPGMLNVLRNKCARSALANVEIRQGAVPANLPDRRFDLIYSSMTLHHVADVPALLRALAARLLPGGRVALADLDAEDGGFHGDVVGVMHHGFDRAEMARWLAAAGLDAVRFSTAHTVRREAVDGGRRGYPIFLVVAERHAVQGRSPRG